MGADTAEIGRNLGGLSGKVKWLSWPDPVPDKLQSGCFLWTKKAKERRLRLRATHFLHQRPLLRGKKM